MAGFRGKDDQRDWIIQKPLSLGHQAHGRFTFKYTMSAIPGINFPQNNESTHDRLDSSWEVPWFFGLFPAHLLSATHPTLRRASRLPRLVPRINLNSVDPSQIFPEHERGLHLKGFFCMKINRGSQMRCSQGGTKGTPCGRDHTAEPCWPRPWPGARCVVLPIF